MKTLIDKIKQSQLNDLSSVFKAGQIVTFLNPYSYLLARKKLDKFKQFDRVGIDGISLVWALKLFGVKTKRYSFDMTSVAPHLYNHCIKNGKSIYFLGSKQEQVERAVKVFQENYPQLNIAGYRNGYFNNEEEKEAVRKEILALNPDFIVVGMGTPYQEDFLLDLKKYGYRGTGFTCGGFLHQTSKGIDYYPAFFNKLNIRWVYRIFDEPKLFKRYFIDYPRSFFLIIGDGFRSGKG